MRIELLSLKLRNFKGIKKLSIEPEGHNLAVYGENGAGKTTIADSFYWLLFDKDSEGKSKFDIKTINLDTKKVVHNLEHEVEGALEVDGKKVVLKKIYYEKWVKKKGSANREFDGHTTDYFINEVPKKAGEYQDYIASIINEDTFKLLTNPGYFNEQLKPQERRKILIDVCGEVSDEEVIESDKKLAELKEIIADRSLDDHKKVIIGKMKKIKKAKDDIPARIDENDRNLPDISNINADEIEADIKALKGAKSEREKELAKVQNGGGIAEKEKKLAELQTELMKIKNEHSAKYEEKIKEKKNELSIITDDIRDIERKIKDKKEDIRASQSTITRLEDNKKTLKANWKKLNEKKKELISEEWEGDTTCYACGQELPEEKIEEAKKKYNQDKAERIEEIAIEQAKITEKGQGINNEIAGIEKEIDVSNLDIENLEKIKAEKTEEIKSLKKITEGLEEKAKAYQDNFEYKKKIAEAEGLQKSIEKLEAGNQDEITSISIDIAGIDTKINELQSKLNLIDQYNKGQARIEELRDQLKKLSAEYEKLEAEKYLMEEFERKQDSMLESKINGQFQLAEFRLFEQQINGGSKQTCETIVEGVPYSTGLNTGAKMNVGIDIINRLSKHYNFYAPIFVDGAESVTNIMKSDSQMIKLVVSGEDKKLRIERDDQ